VTGTQATVGGTLDTTTGFTAVAGTISTPPAAAFASINVQINGCATSEIHYVDKLGLWRGSSPNWSPGLAIPAGATITAAVDANSATPWAPSTAYVVGAVVRPVIPNAHLYQCTTAGTSSASVEPTWPTNGSTVTSGTAVFTDRGIATAATMSANATAATTTAAVTLASLSGQSRTVSVAVVDADGNALSATVMAAVAAYLDAKRELNFVVGAFAPTYTAVGVTATVVVSAGADPIAVQGAVVAALSAYLSPANWAGGDQSPPVWLAGYTLVRYLSVANVIEDVPGVDHITTGTFLVNGGTADVTLAGTAPLPTAGTMTIVTTTS
jgi:hypothetical protein